MYNELIMDYSKLKKYKGKIEDATKVEEGKNLSCGDEITLYLKIENERIVDAKFEGIGCAISQASANLMIENIINKSIDEVKILIDNVYKMTRGEEYDKSVLGLIEELKSIKDYPMRIKCFLLAWKTLELSFK
ncbi:SUF system FeS assembly protein, NifU family [Thermosipho africanus H17ap60334]|jgi:nitrogen fixation NifU-like protein|uniref:Fe-S cluster assembly sulfur transfer protein SufU n=1 Tax=Thermosipho TaxID=2420 RepID=UPI00028C3F2E|nr:MULTISPECIES: SUF system NifU family Fe-S cluster assembly protein [Thermosipho]EKF48724.1 SUF system FeS assembly protein, NifU family [Thermosipho africanus H17ap60334]MBZ4649318.1 system FeS assembly protein NifU family [Thermosipho sp. (in: thermotogales)]MDK2839716.1 nitrogen fixation protein NifU [Thermosipho sp. (in: thermotogales)]MDK2899529.1 nitrogen fixation protein NifU [Thermosipho sp. (in: thermotogales)]RDI92725.1 SUF system FeS assembly protein, NifU family [Thermosipho afri